MQLRENPGFKFQFMYQSRNY